MNQDIKIYTFVVKNQLLKIDTNTIKEIYKNDMYFLKLLESLKMILDEEPEFFWLYPEIIPKIYETLSSKKQNRELIDKINDIIISLNNLKITSETEIESRILQYIDKQKHMRGIHYNINVDSLEDMIIYDCIVYQFIIGQLDAKISIDYICSSLNYFSEFIPEIYNDDIVIDNFNIVMDTALETINKTNSNELNRVYKKTYKKSIINAKKKIEKIIKNNQKIKRKTINN